jgi:hypothetical protein
MLQSYEEIKRQENKGAKRLKREKEIWAHSANRANREEDMYFVA